MPLPVGLRQRGGPCGSRTRNLLLAGELRYLVAPPAHESRERESNPPREAYETSLIPDLPHCDGVTQRGAVAVWLTPLVSTREDSNLQPPACHAGAPPLRHASPWSQERSNLLLPGFNRPLHRQSFRTMSPLEDRMIEGVRDSLDR